MDQQQRFRSDLVEWLGEIVPYGKFDVYVRKTKEIFDSNFEAERGSNSVRYIICTGEHTYSIYAHPNYLGAGGSTRLCRPGEDWTRGNDLPDGPFCYETWVKIKNAIIRYEMVKFDPIHVPTADQTPPSVDIASQTPIDKEHSEAYQDFWRAKLRFEKAERAYAGVDRRDPDGCGLCGGTADRPGMVKMEGATGGQCGTCPQPIHGRMKENPSDLGPAKVAYPKPKAPLVPGRKGTTGFGPGASVGHHRPKKFFGGPGA